MIWGNLGWWWESNSLSFCAPIEAEIKARLSFDQVIRSNKKLINILRERGTIFAKYFRTFFFLFFDMNFGTFMSRDLFNFIKVPHSQPNHQSNIRLEKKSWKSSIHFRISLLSSSKVGSQHAQGPGNDFYVGGARIIKKWNFAHFENFYLIKSQFWGGAGPPAPPGPRCLNKLYAKIQWTK